MQGTFLRCLGYIYSFNVLLFDFQTQHNRTSSLERFSIISQFLCYRDWFMERAYYYIPEKCCFAWKLLTKIFKGYTYSTLSSKACHLIFDGVALWETCLPSKFEWIEWRQVFESYYVTFLLESAASEPWNFHNQWTHSAISTRQVASNNIGLILGGPTFA